MAGYISDDTRKVTTHRLIEMKERGEKISMLTAYDYTMAQIVDGAGMDVILVGDSASNVMAGNVTTLPITLDQMIYHGKSVVRAVKRAMVVVDMPFGSYQGNSKEGLASAIRIMKESHADALKLEGGEEIIETVKRILCAGIPIMGHLGLMPQSINKYGTYTVRAKDEAEAEKLIRDAHLLEEAGCFALVLEKIPAALAKRVASELTIPVIGYSRHVGYEQWFPPPFPASLCRLVHRNDRCYQPLRFGCEELRLPEREGTILNLYGKPIVDNPFYTDMYCQFFIVHILIYAFPGCSGRDGRSFRCSGVSNRSNVSFAYVGNVCYRAFSCLSGRCL